MGTCFSDCLDDFSHKRESKELSRKKDKVASRYQHALTLQEDSVSTWRTQMKGIDKRLNAVKAQAMGRTPVRFTQQEQDSLLQLLRRKVAASRKLRRAQERSTSLDANRNTAMDVIVESHVARAERDAIRQLTSTGLDLEEVRTIRDDNDEFMDELHDSVRDFDSETRHLNKERDDDELLKQMLKEFMDETIGKTEHTFEFRENGYLHTHSRRGVEHGGSDDDEDDVISLSSLPPVPGGRPILAAGTVYSHSEQAGLEIEMD